MEIGHTSTESSHERGKGCYACAPLTDELAHITRYSWQFLKLKCSCFRKIAFLVFHLNQLISHISCLVHRQTDTQSTVTLCCACMLSVKIEQHTAKTFSFAKMIQTWSKPILKSCGGRKKEGRSWAFFVLLSMTNSLTQSVRWLF